MKLTPPAHLSDEAQAAWSEIAATLDTAPDAIEGLAVEAYAVAVARHRDAQARLDKDGSIIADDKGRPIPHPALAIERGAAADMRAWLGRYRKRPR